MLLSLEIPDRIISYLDVICSSGAGKTREELAAHLIEQGAWRLCGENMGFAKPPGAPPPAEDSTIAES